MPIATLRGPERHANAKLIAAAPELLRALVELKRELWAANLKLNIKKHFSLLAADALAGTAIYKAARINCDECGEVCEPSTSGLCASCAYVDA